MSLLDNPTSKFKRSKQPESFSQIDLYQPMLRKRSYIIQLYILFLVNSSSVFELGNQSSLGGRAHIKDRLIT